MLVLVPKNVVENAEQTVNLDKEVVLLSHLPDGCVLQCLTELDRSTGKLPTTDLVACQRAAPSDEKAAVGVGDDSADTHPDMVASRLAHHTIRGNRILSAATHSKIVNTITNNVM